MSQDTVNIEVDGRTLQARKGQMLIEVTDEADLFVPRFCYHKKLTVAANCRMCLVEVEKAPKPLPACATPVADGMKVYTRSPLALRAQKAVMEFLLINHPLDCPICDQGGECELQDLAMGYGRDVSRFQERKRVVKDNNLGPLISSDMTRCIHCTRCVRFGGEIAGIQELGATGRSEHMEIGTYVERSVDSELSGNVIDLCPVGALTNKPFRFRARPWEMTQHGGVSPHDCVGSNLDLHVLRNRIMRAVPRDNEAINETWLSDRDRWGLEGLYAEDRHETPMIKRDGRWEAVDWEDALAFAAEELTRVRSQHGPEEIGALVSPQATTEELHLLQKLVRGLDCPNIDHRLRASDFSDDPDAPPFPWLGQAIADLERVDAALLVGSWPRKDQPLINHRLRKAALRGAGVMVVNPIDHEFNFPLAEKVVTSPDGMVHALAGVLAALDEEGGGEPDAATQQLIGGVAVKDAHRVMAGRLAQAERAGVLLGPVALAHAHASALRALTARVARRSGATLGFLPEGPNSAGAWLAGAVPHRGPGARAAPARGLTAGAMIERGLRAYVLLGVEPELDCANSARAQRALEGADFVVSLTAYRTARMEAYADVLLPLAPFAETPGTFVNAEGRWQSFDAVTSPRGDARPGWRVLRVLGNLLGVSGFEYMRWEEVREELAGLAGEVTPGRGKGWQGEGWRLPGWLPQPTAEDALYRIGEVPLYAVDPVVRRSGPLQRTADAVAGRAAARVNERLARRLGLRAGDSVRVRQNGTGVRLEVIIEPAVPDGCVYLHAGVSGSVGLGPAFGPVTLEKEK